MSEHISQKEFEEFLKQKSERGRMQVLLTHAEKNNQILIEKGIDPQKEIKKERKNKMAEFFKKAFHDMKESAKAQHEVDKANFNAVKAQSKAQWEEAKLSPKQRQEMMQRERDKQIEEANQRIEQANERIENVRNARNK